MSGAAGPAKGAANAPSLAPATVDPAIVAPSTAPRAAPAPRAVTTSSVEGSRDFNSNPSFIASCLE